jgi:nucleoid DNA-binding protein
MGGEAAYLDRCKEDFEPMATKKTAAESTIVGRQELTKRIATQAQLTQKKAAEVLEATLDNIRESLKQGHEVRLVGFGSFKVRRSAARKGVNPRDRKPIQVPAKDRVRFSPGKELSDAVEKK